MVAFHSNSEDLRVLHSNVEEREAKRVLPEKLKFTEVT
jgi:hypothetical protein